MIINWSASPEIVSIGPLTLRWYGLLFAAGFLIGFRFMDNIFRRERKNTEHLDALLLYLILGTTIGARLGHCLFYEPEVYLRDPIRILYIWEGGLASHGGTLGNLISMILFSRRYGYDLRWLIDRLTIPIALTACFIRLGNLMNSEILGKPTGGDWGVVFARVDQIPRHPAMLYESFCYFLTFLLMRHLYYKTDWGLYKGKLWGLFFICIFGTRILVEYAKENQVAFEQGMFMNMGQLLSIPFVLFGAFLIYKSKDAKLELTDTKQGQPKPAKKK
ncbi:MAG TPA: prolipoprotein diacylglyceryl transferase, partial [Bdellovibrionales bacterium]|nr:prolipoprotein diacylglyceryl transferase [Bdellovibrionales bacterium]